MNHSYEEIRSAALDLLAGREHGHHDLNQYGSLQTGVAEVFSRREGVAQAGPLPVLSQADSDLFLEVFWTLFREGIITLGINDSNREFPFFKITGFGRHVLQNSQTYFFHDVASYQQLIRTEVPAINDVTLAYLTEAMQSFRTGCLLAATVMLGVAAEHTFMLLLEKVDQNPAHQARFARVKQERTVLGKATKFWTLLQAELSGLSPEVREDLEIYFTGIQSVIRNVRNQSGHPTGKVMAREQVYVLLNLFIPYCKKLYQLIDYFS